MHPTVRIFAAFLFAVALASAALYAIDRSRTSGGSKASIGPGSTHAPVVDAPKIADLTSPARPAIAPAISTPPPLQPLPLVAASAPLAENGNTIAKCSVDGKIIYTNKSCPLGSKAKPLQIIDNAVIPGYDRATVENTFRQPPPMLAQTQPAPAGGVIEPVTSISAEPNVDCPALGRRLNWLNGMSHRRQPPHVYDRMRRERDDLQTRMFWAHC
jgi:hypothetical protein